MKYVSRLIRCGIKGNRDPKMATANPVAESGQGNGTNMKIDLLPTPEELRVARKLKAEKYRNMVRSFSPAHYAVFFL